MRPEAIRSEMRAVLTRASDVEARRLAAKDRGDWPAVAQCERELSALWRRHADLECAGDEAFLPSEQA
jgi:hypothetical protein